MKQNIVNKSKKWKQFLYVDNVSASCFIDNETKSDILKTYLAEPCQTLSILVRKILNKG